MGCGPAHEAAAASGPDRGVEEPAAGILHHVLGSIRVVVEANILVNRVATRYAVRTRNTVATLDGEIHLVQDDKASTVLVLFRRKFSQSRVHVHIFIREYLCFDPFRTVF
jgi:hypothetical protein